MATDPVAIDRAADRIYALFRDCRRINEAWSAWESEERIAQANPDARLWVELRTRLGLDYDERQELTTLIAGIIAEEMGR